MAFPNAPAPRRNLRPRIHRGAKVSERSPEMSTEAVSKGDRVGKYIHAGRHTVGEVSG